MVNVDQVVNRNDIRFALDVVGNQVCGCRFDIIRAPRVEKIAVTVSMEYTEVIGSLEESEHQY